jgi:ketosteroid isomerase-like protein
LRAYEAWNRRDFDAATADVDPQVYWTFGEGTRFPGTSGEYHGISGVREFWDTFIEPWEEVQIEVEETHDHGEAIVVFIQFHAKAREGLAIDMASAHLHVVKDGRLVRFESFEDGDEALKAAGLSE